MFYCLKKWIVTSNVWAVCIINCLYLNLECRFESTFFYSTLFDDIVTIIYLNGTNKIADNRVFLASLVNLFGMEVKRGKKVKITGLHWLLRVVLKLFCWWFLFLTRNF